MVGDGLEGVGAVDAVQEALDDGPVIDAVGGQVLGVDDPALLPLLDAVELDLFHPDALLRQVEGGRMAGDLGLRLPGDEGGDRLEQLLLLDGVLVTLVDDVVDGGVIEGEHGVPLELVVDAEVQHRPGGTVGGGGQEGDRLQEEVDGGVELVQFAVDGHVRADDDVRAHRPGDVDGIVVPHAAVQEHLAVLAHGPEVERDGHRGPEGVGDLAGGPVLGRHRVEVRRDAGVGDGQVREADAVLVVHGDGTEHIPDVEAVQKAVGHAEAHPGDGLVEHIGRTVPGFRRHLVGDPFVLETVCEVLVIVVMRDAQDVLVAVLADFVADVFLGNVIRHHNGPFDGAHEGIQLVVLVAQGVQAAHEAAHAGARDDVDGDAQFFHIFDHAQVREAAGAATGQDQAHRGPVLPDRVHPRADLRERGLISLGLCAGQDRDPDGGIAVGGRKSGYLRAGADAEGTGCNENG